MSVLATRLAMSLCMQVFTFTWREDIRPGDPQHTKKFCFDAVSHTSPVTLYDCHSMKGNQLWKYRKVWGRGVAWGTPEHLLARLGCRSEGLRCLLLLPADPAHSSCSASDLALRDRTGTQTHAF